MVEKLRLQKYIAQNSEYSRRKSEELISKGKVKVNGRFASLGDKIDPQTDVVSVLGEVLLSKNKENIYLALNKPRGYVTTMNDEKGRKCVKDLLKGLDRRVFPVGRLDKDSEGLLLLTDDGEFSNAVTHPSNNIEKTYRVCVKPAADDRQISLLMSGVVIDGKATCPAKILDISNDTDRTRFTITINEGRNREIRKMCERVGLSVARLKRVSIGNFKLGSLKPGEYKILTKDEVNLIFK